MLILAAFKKIFWLYLKLYGVTTKNHIPWNTAILSGISFSVPSLSMARRLCFPLFPFCLSSTNFFFESIKGKLEHIFTVCLTTLASLCSIFNFNSQGVFQNHESDFKIMSQIISLHWAQYAEDFPSTQSKSQSPYNGLWGPLCSAACNFSSHPLLLLLISPSSSFLHEHSCSSLSCSTFFFNLGFITSKIIF